MIDIKSDKNFEILFKRLYRFVDSVETIFKAPRMSWTLGGGTALAIEYQHRESYDLDIFISDVQYLGCLTPRKNPVTENEVTDYMEQSNYLKLDFGMNQIDFIVSPTLTDISPKKMNVFGRNIEVEAAAEILAKKIHYRAGTLKGRDIFDIACVVNKEPEITAYLAEFAHLQKDVLEARLSFCSNRLREEYQSFVDKYGGMEFQYAIELLKDLSHAKVKDNAHLNDDPLKKKSRGR